MNESSRTSLPGSTSVSSVPESASRSRSASPGRTGESSDASAALAENQGVSEDEGPVDLSHVPEEYRDSLRRLYRKVGQATDTIERLRAENERLRDRVEELEAQPAFPEDDTVFLLDDDPEVVRDRITSFIEAIDAYLDASTPAAASDDEAPDTPDDASSS